MDIIQYTINWVKGEIFEANIIGVFGLMTIICSLLFWIFGANLNSKAVIIHFLLVGIFFLITAISGIVNNKMRVIEYTDAYQRNKVELVFNEKKELRTSNICTK
jgi:hypothetical protein